MGFEYHEAANIFPIDDSVVADLAKDIKKNGQLYAIQLLDNQILDGRQRYLACLKAGVTPKTIEADIEDPVTHVLSLNLKRRQLDHNEASMAAAAAKELRKKFEAEAKKNLGLSKGRGKKGRAAPPDLKSPKIGRSRDDVGEKFGVSGRSVASASKILKQGSKKVIQSAKTKTKKGGINITEAERIVKKHPNDQEAQDAELVIVQEWKKKRGAKPVNPVKPKGTKGSQDKRRELALSAVTKSLNSLQHGPLVRLSKKNPYREEAIKKVISWLRQRLKD